ncbi:MAG: hypothetical protein QXH03_00315 [Candidatus Bathyarchaeia archaeon]
MLSVPPKLVEFMVALATPPRNSCRILEPACGNCPFLKAFARYYGYHHEFTGIDIDSKTIRQTRTQVPFATLILWQPGERFDIIIGNPPYGITPSILSENVKPFTNSASKPGMANSTFTELSSNMQ